jgi:hypothetical protein
MAIDNSLIGTSDTDVFTASQDSAVTAIFICNYSTTDDVKVQMYIGTSSGSSSQVLKDLIIYATDTYVFEQSRILLDQNDKIIMSANTASVASVTISSTGI